MRRIYLMDSFDSFFDYSQGECISLDPGVSYSLAQKGVPYKILEEFYDEKDLRSQEQDYFFEQLKWFDMFDGFLRENITLCRDYNIFMAHAAYIRIKYCLDSAVIYCYCLERMFRTFDNDTEIVFMHNPFSEEAKYSLFDFKLQSRRVFCELVELFCRKHKIRYTDKYVHDPRGFVVRPSLPEEEPLPPLKYHAKKLRNILKYEKLGKKSDALKNVSFLFMHAGSIDIDYPLKQCIKHGARVYLIERGLVMREDILLRRQISVPGISDYIRDKTLQECKACAEKLALNLDLVSWINDRCYLDVSQVVVPFLQNFISEDSPLILCDAERMSRFYSQNGIDYVFARGNSDKRSLGPIVGAKYMQEADSVCTEHSCFALDHELFGVFETETYDYILTRDRISQDFFENSLKNRHNHGCHAHLSTHYLRGVKGKYSRNKKKGEKETVVYVQKKFVDRVRSFNNMIYPMAWYFEFQKKIVDFFSAQKEFDFIYKHSPGQIWAENSILKYINDKGYENIKVSDEHFLGVLAGADRVIVDYPSGAFFEAAVCSKSVLCVCADYYRVLGKAKDVFGKSLRQFSSPEEALSIMEEFLRGEAANYTVNLDITGEDFVKIIRSFRAEHEKDWGVENDTNNSGI